ncbi:MAG: NBR1-Ig-like domain-containing protein [Anaerolineaceae bacterium]
MKKSNFWWIIMSVMMVSVLLLGACSPSGTPTASPEELAQQVANTQMARATEMAVATLVMRVTELSAPTNTPEPTATPQPTPTPQPTVAVTASTEATPVQPTTAPVTDNPIGESPKVWANNGKCYFQMQYLGDVNYPPDSIVKAGTAFTKIWRVKNTGTCPWESNEYNVDLHFEGGDQMSGAPVQDIHPTTVNPGDTVEVSVKLAAPATAGTYMGFWLPTATDKVRFGYGDKNQYSLAVKIIVN